MTLKEWLDKYFAPEYLNVQDKAAWKTEAEAALHRVLKLPPPVK